MSIDFDFIKYQQQLREVFNALEKKNKALTSKQHKLGYQQRNELITHVLSGYKNDEKLIAKKKEWEDAGVEQRVVKWLYDMMRDRLDLYGYFENPEEMVSMLKVLIQKAEKMEMFEKAQILNYWYIKLVKA